MPQRDDEHPRPEALARFALGSLPQGRAETVANHVAGCATCAATVDAAPPDFVLRRLTTVLHAETSAADPATTAHPPPTSFPVPAALRRFSKYQDFQLLGVGGMGLVFKAWQPAAQRFVALKVIQPELLGRPEVKARLLREAQTLQRLHHPNIVGIHDVEELDDLIVVVMEYVEGKNLGALGRDGKLSVADACCYARQAACGLQHAHEQGFVHRDIKPENLIVGADGQVKIVDFGIVRFVATEELSPDLTADDALLGSPKYMAPEQARDPGSATVPSDLYALGCTLFYLLTGRPPYQERTVIGVLVAQASQEPPSVRSLRPDVPSVVDTLIQRLLAKRPAHRPQTATEVSAALTPFVDAAACSSASTQRRFVKPRATVLILICLVLAALALLGTQLLRVQTPFGTIVVENLPKDAEVTIDGAMATIRRAGAKEVVEIRAQAGKRKLEIRLQGAVIHSQDVVVELAGRHLLPIRLETPQGKVVAPAAVGKSAVVPDLAEPLTLTGHTHYVWSVAFSPDGQRLISGAQDNTVKLWDAVKGSFIQDIAHDRDRFTGVAWSPNGKLLAAGGVAPVIQVWNADSGVFLHNLRGHDAGVRCVAFSRDGKWLASGSYDKTVRLWDLSTGKEKYALREHAGLVHGVAFSHDDKHLASGSFDRTIRLWDVGTGEEKGCLCGHTGDVLGVAFDPQSKRLASASQDGTVRIWNLNRDGDDRVLRASVPQHRVFAVAFSPDGKILASGSDKALILWNPETGAEIAQLAGNTKSVFGLSFSRDGRRLASAGGDNTVRVFDVTLVRTD